ncbi:MAG: 3-phosphoshikimate 1-carboxyvinyltransferase [Clostridia bacterium]|nr:3-phosphoshikimate 1-carboxyvinyltransferase [Clostridia bacterium]
MNVVVSKSEIFGSVCVPPSKSVAHRLMIAAMLAGGRLGVKDGGKDMQATAQCLDIIGQAMRVEACHVCDMRTGVCGMFGAVYGVINVDEGGELPILNAGESGSTLRFLLPIVCALGLKCVITGEGRLKDRPLGELVNTLAANGAVIERIESGQLPLKTGGKLRAGKYEIDGGISSQYVTGLLFALPLLDGDSEIVIRGELVSSNYVDITLGVLADFGIAVQKTDYGYYVKGNQKYILPQDLTVEGDWSSAAFMLALGVLSGEVRVRGLKCDSLQGDKVIVDLLKLAGADISVSYDESADNNVLSVKAESGNEYNNRCFGEVVARKSELHAIDFDAKHCPDIVPIMAAVLSFANGKSHISSVDRLRDKESDRLSAVRTLLSHFGIRTEYTNDVLTIFGGRHTPSVNNGVHMSADSEECVQSVNEEYAPSVHKEERAHTACHTHGFLDHRMAMSAIVMALNTNGTSRVDGVECISKSYPTFVEHAVALGAKIVTEN